MIALKIALDPSLVISTKPDGEEKFCYLNIMISLFVQYDKQHSTSLQRGVRCSALMVKHYLTFSFGMQ